MWYLAIFKNENNIDQKILHIVRTLLATAFGSMRLLVNVRVGKFTRMDNFICALDLHNPLKCQTP